MTIAIYHADREMVLSRRIRKEGLMRKAVGLGAEERTVTPPRTLLPPSSTFCGHWLRTLHVWSSPTIADKTE